MDSDANFGVTMFNKDEQDRKRWQLIAQADGVKYEQLKKWNIERKSFLYFLLDGLVKIVCFPVTVYRNWADKQDAREYEVLSDHRNPIGRLTKEQCDDCDVEFPKVK